MDIRPRLRRNKHGIESPQEFVPLSGGTYSIRVGAGGVAPANKGKAEIFACSVVFSIIHHLFLLANLHDIDASAYVGRTPNQQMR